MVQGIENWAQIKGVVEGLHDSEIEDHVTVRVRVDDVSAVGSFPNLFKDDAGRVIDVLVPRDVADANALGPGVKLSSRVRRAGLTKAFAHPDHVRRLEG